MYGGISGCVCGNENVAVIATEHGTQIYCAVCGRRTTSRTREAAMRMWNARSEKSRRAAERLTRKGRR